jgi:hypothetical protein
MLKPIFFGVALSLFAFDSYASDPACAKMKSWAKVEGYRYKTSIKSLPVDEDDHSENEGAVIICDASGNVAWTAKHISESFDFVIEAKELDGDKRKEISVVFGMGAAYPYAVEYILQVEAGSLFEVGALQSSLPDGAVYWEDLNNDGAQEAIFDPAQSMSRGQFVPTVYTFEADGSLAEGFLSDYPAFIQGRLDSLYEACSSGDSFDGCINAEAIFLSAKSGLSLEIEPIAPLDASIPHASFVGWTEDSAEFGYCAPVDEKPSANRCEFSSEKKTRSLTDYVGGAISADKTKEISAEADKKRVNAVVLFNGIQDLKPAWKITSSNKWFVFSIGAQRLGNQPAYLHSLTVDLKKEKLNAKLTTAHADAISLSPDGKLVGVLFHVTDGSKHVYQTKVSSVNKIASNTYNVAGLEHHKQERFGFSAALFSVAYELDKTAKWPAFNLACAHARLGDEAKTMDALDIVIAQKNKDIIKKIATDPDLAGMRGEPWFGKYVTP